MNEEKRIKEIRARCEAATEGPWEIHNTPDYAEIHVKGGKEQGYSPVALADASYNAAFISHSREDIPFLLDHIAELEKQLSESQRREKAATRDLEYVCGSSGEFELRSICDICRRKQTDGTCPTQCEMNSLAAGNKWEWRGPQDEKGE